MIKVRQMVSPKSYNAVANQFVITETDPSDRAKGYRYEYLQSYSTIIARREVTKHGQVYITLDEAYWNYSNTTAKYRREFLGENTAETRKKIASGEYMVANLNEDKH